MVLDVVLSWDLSPTPAADVTEQRVYRSVAVNPSFPEDYTQIATLGGEVTTYTDTDVIPDPDLPLTYAVTAANSGVESSPTTAGADALYDTTPIDVSLSWNLSPSELSSVDGQRLYRSFVENPTFPDNYTQIASLTASETSYIDTNALQTETYNYGVTTFNSAGESSPTTTAVNTPYPVKVDGDFVYTLTANGADVTGIQVNGQAVLGAPVIPDSGMFQSPLYQYTVVAGLNAADGGTASNWTEQLAGAGDATAVGSPIYRSDQSGFEAVEYDGADDGHNFASDGQLPTGADPVSVAMTVYVKTLKDFNCIFSYGNSNAGGAAQLLLNSSGEVRPDLPGEGYNSGGSFSTGNWITVGASFSDSQLTGFLNGSQVVTDTPVDPLNLTDENRSLAYRANNSDFFSDIYIYDAVICAADESEQAFSDYHTDRLG